MSSLIMVTSGSTIMVPRIRDDPQDHLGRKAKSFRKCLTTRYGGEIMSDIFFMYKKEITSVNRNKFGVRNEKGTLLRMVKHCTGFKRTVKVFFDNESKSRGGSNVMIKIFKTEKVVVNRIGGHQVGL